MKVRGIDSTGLDDAAAEALRKYIKRNGYRRTTPPRTTPHFGVDMDVPDHQSPPGLVSRRDAWIGPEHSEVACDFTKRQRRWHFPYPQKETMLSGSGQGTQATAMTPSTGMKLSSRIDMLQETLARYTRRFAAKFDIFDSIDRDRLDEFESLTDAGALPEWAHASDVPPEKTQTPRPFRRRAECLTQASCASEGTAGTAACDWHAPGQLRVMARPRAHP